MVMGSEGYLQQGFATHSPALGRGSTGSSTGGLFLGASTFSTRDTWPLACQVCFSGSCCNLLEAAPCGHGLKHLLGYCGFLASLY
jgi:hypothetical protein